MPARYTSSTTARATLSHYRARYADKSNTVPIPAARYGELNSRRNGLLAARGRPANQQPD